MNELKTLAHEAIKKLDNVVYDWMKQENRYVKKSEIAHALDLFDYEAETGKRWAMTINGIIERLLKQGLLEKIQISSRRYQFKIINKPSKYTEEELEIVDYVENSNPKSIPNLKEEIELITSIVSESTQKKKQVNFRLFSFKDIT